MGAIGRLRLQAALALGLMTALSVQQEGQAGVHWIFPPPDETPTFHHGDVVNVTWTSSFPTPILVTFCRDTNVDQVKLMDVSGYNASALVELDFDHADGKCWFDLKPDMNGGKGSNSESFSYVSDTGDQATIGLSSSSSSSTASSSTQTSSAEATTTAADAGGSAFESTKTNLPASATSSSTSAASTASGDAAHLSTGAQAGLGVGIGIAGIGIGGLAIFLLLRRRRKNPTDPSMQQGHYDGSIPLQSAYYGTLKGHAHGVAVYDGHTSTSPDYSLNGGAGSTVVEAPSGYSSPGNTVQHGVHYNPVPQELDAPQYEAQELPATRHV
ncbi:hypothetical protein BJ166DRAFT_59273 [Pestalotiopsis sp. NC0098]|nr:hypothetical protein BJ166DRAFT_59273 [Pestalotiopsis sp. NC0098]